MTYFSHKRKLSKRTNNGFKFKKKRVNVRILYGTLLLTKVLHRLRILSKQVILLLSLLLMSIYIMSSSPL